MRSERAIQPILMAQRAKIRPKRAKLRPPMAKGGDGRTEGRKDGRLEIPPCVLQDIGPLGPLPKKKMKVEKYFPQTMNSG